MLYQLLVGDLRRQLVPGWEREIDDPLLREDLARATDGDPQQRLKSVGELLDRLRLLDERREVRERESEAQARSVAAQRALEASRARRPWILAVCCALALGLGMSLWLYRDSRQAQARAESINRFLNWEVLANTGALKTDRDPDPSMRRVLHNASTAVGESFAGDPGSEGWIRLAIGEGLGGLGDYAAAEAEERRAVELLTRAYGPSHPRTLDAVYTLAGLMMEQSKFREVEPLLDDADRRLAGVADTGSPVIMRGRTMRGAWFASRRQCVQALATLEAAAEAQQRVANAMTYDAFSIRSWIGGTLLCLGRYGEAEVLYAELLGPRYPEEEIGAAQLNWARIGYAELQSLQGRHEEADRTLTSALPALEESLGDSDPFTLGQALIKAGSIYARLQDFAAARERIERGLGLLRRVHQGQISILDGERTLGAIAVLSGRPQEALPLLDHARSGFVAALGDTNAEVQGTDYWRARALADLGEQAAAAAAAKGLQPEMLRASLGGEGWMRRLDALTSSAKSL
jgi:non-specific serine/threonine protein kinase